MLRLSFVPSCKVVTTDHSIKTDTSSQDVGRGFGHARIRFGDCIAGFARQRLVDRRDMARQCIGRKTVRDCLRDRASTVGTSASPKTVNEHIMKIPNERLGLVDKIRLKIDEVNLGNDMNVKLRELKRLSSTVANVNRIMSLSELIAEIDFATKRIETDLN